MSKNQRYSNLIFGQAINRGFVGLGLGIAKTIVQLGGLIALGDRPGGGLLVTVQLPFHFVTN